MSELVKKVEAGDYQELFIKDLNWYRPDHPPLQVSVADRTWMVRNVASYTGLRVWVCPDLPDAAAQVAIDRQVATTTTDRLVIFHSPQEQVWRWPGRVTRGDRTTVRLTSHRHRTGNPDPGFAAKLEAITLPVTEELDTHEVLAKLRSAFDIEARNETRHASKLMAAMYTTLEGAYPPGMSRAERDHEISVILARVLFLMFGDDTGMWRTDQFRDFMLGCAPDGSDTHTRLTELFECLNTPPEGRAELAPEYQEFRYVNGGIFAETVTVPPVGRRFRELVLEACDRDWSAISPAIFGSMFQSVRDAEVRRQLGEHYTSEENILKTLNPLFLDELRAEYDKARNAGTPRKELNALHRLRERLGRIRFMDPACGCGNFIIVAYRELRDLELAIMERVADLTGQPPQLLANVGLAVRLENFYGIEIDEWPARIAQTAMFLVDRQCDLKLEDRLGLPIDRLPIREQATILVGNALRTDWAQMLSPSEDVVIAGNPPFIGARYKDDDQGEDLRKVWGRGFSGDLDYVSGWYIKAAEFFGHVPGRFAFVSTNSICQGAGAPPLFGPLRERGWYIAFAHRTFPWTSEAAGKAAVHCVIVGMRRDEDQVQPRLFDHNRQGEQEVQARTINAYLVDGPWVLVHSRTNPISPVLSACRYGSMPNDDRHLIVEQDEYEAVAADPIARKYLRPFRGAEEVVKGLERWCLWLVDATTEELQASPILRTRVRAVREYRLASKREATRKLAAQAHLFGERRQPSVPYLCIPRVGSEGRAFLPVARFDPHVIASDAVFTAADPTGLLFAVLSSSMTMTWLRTVGGRLKSDPRFSNRIVWNNLPLPPLTEDLHEAIVTAGRGIERARAQRPEWTLTQHYDPAGMEPSLVQAHEALDEVVARAFGATARCRTELERQELLFARYAELTEHRST